MPYSRVDEAARVAGELPSMYRAWWMALKRSSNMSESSVC